MNEEKAAIQEWKAKIDQWGQKITELKEKAQAAPESARQETEALIERLETQTVLIGQYLKQLASEGKDFGGKAAELEHMFADVDNVYRDAISYFH
jgi:chromosome segregation ATPase